MQLTSPQNYYSDSNVRGFGFSEDFAAGMVLCVILLCNNFAFGTVSEEDNWKKYNIINLRNKNFLQNFHFLLLSVENSNYHE